MKQKLEKNATSRCVQTPGVGQRPKSRNWTGGRISGLPFYRNFHLKGIGASVFRLSASTSRIQGEKHC